MILFSGLNQPNRLIIDNNILYVKGGATPGGIVQIDLSSSLPSASVLFNSLPVGIDSIGIGNIIKEGNTFYISYVNDNTGESTLASFNVSTPTILNNIVSSLGYVSAIDVYNGELYFTNEDLSGGGTSLKKIDISISNPPVFTVLTGLTNPQDMEFKGSTLYIGDRDANTIYSVDVLLVSPTLTSFVSGVNVRGVYVYNDFLYFSDGGTIKKTEFSNSTNITTEAMDTGSSTDFLRDVVISGNKLYMPQENFGKIVSKEDLTLSVTNETDQLIDLSFHNNDNNIFITGLTDLNSEIKIYSLTGSQLVVKEVDSDDSSIDISYLSKGIYLLNMDNKKTFKFVK
ncbi:T9SS type A sorting domain-containing protein [Algibacter miyuki]|uniref:T9SS type A sorting domain-containing protein n=1 Tax=Algibacter miyuki TaxID=1306933 RepID=A0ABV5H0H0_9FLAO|nr:T9SS type A sorting domain-containing protein [Algibacter miyuki]MDN3667373.1 T9SS type A sorting domain-containing protein [Algibacter miyuki]